MTKCALVASNLLACICCAGRVSQTCCVLAAGLGCDPRPPIKAECQQHMRPPAAVDHHECQTKQSSFGSMAARGIKALMAASSSLNCCKHPCQWTASRLRQSVGKLTRSRGGFPRPALALCQCQAAEATGWWRVPVEGRLNVGRKMGGDGKRTQEKKLH